MQSSYRETLPVALNLTGRSVLVLGGAEEALDKVEKFRRVGARLSLVSERVCPELALLAQHGELPWFARPFVETDLNGCRLVVLTEQDALLAQRLWLLRERYPFWLCAVDQPDYCDLSMVSTVRRGPLQIGISTGGGAPLLARRVRQALEAGLDPSLGDFARSFADLRASLRALPKAERRALLSEALHGFALEVRVSYPEGSDFCPR